MLIRTKEFGMEEQQRVEVTLKEKAMEHLCVACNRDELFKLMAKVNDRITYLDNQEQAFRGLYGRAN